MTAETSKAETCVSCGFPWGMNPVRHAEICGDRRPPTIQEAPADFTRDGVELAAAIAQAWSRADNHVKVRSPLGRVEYYLGNEMGTRSFDLRPIVAEALSALTNPPVPADVAGLDRLTSYFERHGYREYEEGFSPLKDLAHLASLAQEVERLKADYSALKSWWDANPSLLARQLTAERTAKEAAEAAREQAEAGRDQYADMYARAVGQRGEVEADRDRIKAALEKARAYVELKADDAFDSREEMLLAVIDAALTPPTQQEEGGR